MTKGEKISRALKGRKGKRKTEEQKRKQSDSMKGKVPWNKGTKGVMVAWNKGLKTGPSWNKGLKASLKARKNQSESHKGHMHSVEQKKKQSDALKGIPHTEEHNRKVREAKGALDARKAVSETMKKIISEKRGIVCSDRQYGWDWTETLRRAVRERDNYTCQVCGKEFAPNGKQPHVHHIDYDKEDNNPSNLITLCIGCHMKTSIGDAVKWQDLFAEVSSR